MKLKSCLFLFYSTLIPLISSAQDCRFDKDKIITNDLGKTLVKCTKSVGGISIARFEEIKNSENDSAKNFSYFIGVYKEDFYGWTKCRSYCQIDSAKLSFGKITLMNYEKTKLNNYTGLNNVTYEYYQLFEVTVDQLKQLSGKEEYVYTINAHGSKDGNYLDEKGRGFVWGAMSKKESLKTAKNIDCILNLQ